VLTRGTYDLRSTEWHLIRQASELEWYANELRTHVA